MIATKFIKFFLGEIFDFLTPIWFLCACGKTHYKILPQNFDILFLLCTNFIHTRHKLGHTNRIWACFKFAFLSSIAFFTLPNYFAKLAVFFLNIVAIVLPLPNPNDPKQHEACCPLCKQTLNDLLLGKSSSPSFKPLHYYKYNHKCVSSDSYMHSNCSKVDSFYTSKSDFLLLNEDAKNSKDLN